MNRIVSQNQCYKKQFFDHRQIRVLHYQRQHDKSFYFEEIYPLIKDKVNYIFAGDGKRQYFRDLEDKLNYGKQNVNVIHWLDKIGKINAYAVGTGDGDPKAIFTIVDILNNNELGKISKEQRAGEFDVWATDLVNPNFAEYASNCGALGIRVTDSSKLADALKEVLNHNGPALLEVTTDVGLI